MSRGRPKKAIKRIDYYYDSTAPEPKTRRPSASVVVRDATGRLLMLRRIDSGRWTVPTGALKIGETIATCGVRECREETGIEVEITGMVGVFSDPNHVIVYRRGAKVREVRQPVNICLRARPLGGSIAPAPREASEVRWTEPAELAALDIHPAIQLRIARALDEGSEPYIG